MEEGASFSEWLKRERKGRDLTQLELAERVGCSESAIRKFELGERRPSKQVVELLADFQKLHARNEAEAAPADKVGNYVDSFLKMLTTPESNTGQ